MRRSVPSSPRLTIALAIALAVSLAFHVVGGAPAGADGPRVLAFEVSGPALRPTLLVDFDAAMTTAAGVGEPLDADLVALDPPIAVEAAFVTPYRLRIRPAVGLPPFTTFRVRLGAAFADARGRAVDLEAGPRLAFPSSVFGLDEPPAPHVGAAGDDVLCSLAFNGPVRRAELEQHLRLESAAGEAIPFTVEGEGVDWTLRPERVEAEGAVLLIGGGLSRGRGGADDQPDRRYPLTWPTTLRVTDVRIRGRDRGQRIELRFSHHLADQDAASFVALKPAVADLAVEVRGTRLILHGRFPPRRTLDIEVRKGLRAVQGLALAEDVVRYATIPPLEPAVRIAPRGRTLSTAARPELEIEGVNVPAVDVTIHEVHASNVVPLALGWRSAPGLAREPRTKRIAVEAPLDERWNRRLDLASILGRVPHGIYQVAVADSRERWTRDTRLLQLTDLAPVVRVRPDRLVVLVTRLSDGSVVAAARVEAFDEKNQLVASGDTDEHGLLVVPAKDPFVLTVSTADDRAYVDLRTHGLAHDARQVEGRAPATGAEAFVYADRGVVRPGETCRVGAVLRLPTGHAPAEGLPVELALRAPDERVLTTWTRRTDAHGMVALDVPFPRDAPTGPYCVDVTGPGRDAPWGRVSFRVETIVPDRIEPALRLPPGDLRFGDTVAVTLGASLLTGRPAPGLQARVRVRYAPDPDVPVDGVVFGDADAAPAPFRVDLADVRLDAAGQATLEVRLPAANASGVPLRAAFELEVVDVSGRASFVRETRRVVSARGRLGLAAPVDGSFDVPVVAEGAGEVRGTAVLERLRWEGGYVHEHGRAWPVWRADLVAQAVQERPFELVDGRGLARFDDAGDGRYRVRVRAEGLAGASRRFDRWGGRIERSADDGGAPRLDLTLVEETVVPGKTAMLQVDAPFAGRGLLTVEGPGVLEARVVNVRAGLQSFEVVAPDAPAPNVHATLTVLRGVREAGDGNARALGAVRVPLARPDRRLAVGLDLPARAVPGTDLEVRVRTSRPATVRVHLVDEGVLRLTGHRTPDPHAFFEAPRRLDTRLADAYTALLERMRFGGDDAEPGGGEGVLAARLDPTARKTIETVALASALVTCAGDARISFVLPEQYEGRLRVFAVAAAEASTGVASASLVLEAPISVAVHVPRAAAPGDEFVVPIQVRGENVTWDVTLDGLERVSETGPLRVRAGDRMGVASVVVRATDAAGHETLRRARLAIRPPAPYVVRHEVRRLAAGELADQDLPGAWLSGHRRARLTIGASGLLGLLPALDRLLEYPYGCVEQTTSRAFPLLALSELARAGHPEGAAPRDTVTACVDRLLGMQTSDGGLATWPGGRQSYPYGSAYAAHFLLEARRFGRPVPDRPLAALLDYLEGRVRDGDVDAYTARVLALGGRAVTPFLERLAEEATRAEDVANLAAAYLRTGDRARADAMLAKAGDPWAAPTKRGGSLDSPLRAAATLLSALVDARPDDARIPELVERLTAAVQTGSEYTTQTDAAVLTALAKVHAGPDVGARAVRGVLRAGGREHAFDGSDGLVATVEADAPWRMGLSADGPVTLVLRTEGIPLDAAEGDLEHGIQVARRIVAPAGPLRQGRVYEVVIEGRAPEGCENLLVTDVLPGGLELEATRDREGTLEPDRVEPRDDRVLFFRTRRLKGAFRQTYLVRAVTVGRFHVPPVTAELLYAPAVHGRSSGGGTLEIVR